jgi:hypothetical protein
MNIRVIDFFSPRLRGLYFSAAFVLLLASCMDNNDDFVTEPVQVAYVSVYHASPDAPDLDIVVDNKAININPFDYAAYTGYLNFFTGNRNIKFNASNATSALIDTTFNFEDGKAYSIFAVDQLSRIEALLVVDSAARPAEGKAMVRFVQLSPDAPALDLSTPQQPGSPVFSNNSFKQATDFQEIEAKTYTFNISHTGVSDALVVAKDVNLLPGRYYTIITRGFVNPPAGNTNVLSIEVVE